jgi:hypothetical protein
MPKLSKYGPRDLHMNGKHTASVAICYVPWPWHVKGLHVRSHMNVLTISDNISGCAQGELSANKYILVIYIIVISNSMCGIWKNHIIMRPYKFWGIPEQVHPHFLIGGFNPSEKY